jgi:hypothetical protein
MSFRCEKCKEQQPPHSEPNFVVVEWKQLAAGGKQIARVESQCDICAGKKTIPIGKEESDYVSTSGDSD